jgi:hypothetical protein
MLLVFLLLSLITDFFTADSGQTKKDDFISIRPATAGRITICPAGLVWLFLRCPFIIINKSTLLNLLKPNTTLHLVFVVIYLKSTVKTPFL